ncbi:MAG: hypothetical protein KGR47_10955 [Acidobacteria bacterium]|nr:hypothetical protein [Acidobacteriota bacterium]
MRVSIHRARLLLGGAALAVAALGAGCSGDDSSSGSSSSGEVATSAAVSTIQSSIDPAQVLKDAVAGLAGGYHFVSNVVVNGAQTLLASGDRLGTGSRLELTSNGATVKYVILPDASWAQPEGGEWELLDVPPASTDPMSALTAPISIGVLSDSGGEVKLRVTVLATALGVGSEGNAEVDVIIKDGALVEVDYATPVAGGVASVATTFGPVVDPTPVAPPA